MALPTIKRVSCFVVAILSVVVAQFVDSTAAREGSMSRGPLPGKSHSQLTRSSDPDRPGTRRLREGTLVSDQNGYFREDGDGATFVADTGMEFGALQNLNLERVVRLLKNAEEPGSIRWSVSGKVTEFSGHNFLLISRAVYKSATPPPVPDRMVQE